jgi:hypothetical protein
VLVILLTAIGVSWQVGVKQAQWMFEKSGSQILAKGTYLTLDEVKNGYLSKETIADQYISKRDIERLYVASEKYKSLEAENIQLKSKAEIIDSALTHFTKQLIVGQTWHPKNPEFYISFDSYIMAVDGSESAKLLVSFVDSQPYTIFLTKPNTSKTSTFVYNGQPYELKTAFRKSKDEVLVEANLQISKLDKI